jgi:gluconolactonase
MRTLQYYVRLLACAGAVSTLSAQTAPTNSSVIAPGAKLELLQGGLGFAEGPTCDPAGNVFFTDQPNNRILKWGVDGKLSTFLEPTGRANGMSFDGKGNLITCSDENTEVWRIAPDGTHTVLVGEYSGKHLNAPNDVWVRPDGGLYLTDCYDHRAYWTYNQRPQDSEEVYFLAAGQKTLQRVTTDLGHPTGIAGTPDGKTLYVSDMRPNSTFAYDMQPDGTLTNKRLICTFGSDGMTVDNEGNLYMTGAAGVTVFDKTGKKLETIPVAERWTGNVCFGGKDRQTLFITASKGLYAIRMRVKGANPWK